MESWKIYIQLHQPLCRSEDDILQAAIIVPHYSLARILQEQAWQCASKERESTVAHGQTDMGNHLQLLPCPDRNLSHSFYSRYCDTIAIELRFSVSKINQKTEWASPSLPILSVTCQLCAWDIFRCSSPSGKKCLVSVRLWKDGTIWLQSTEYCAWYRATTQKTLPSTSLFVPDNSSNQQCSRFFWSSAPCWQLRLMVGEGSTVSPLLVFLVLCSVCETKRVRQLPRGKCQDEEVVYSSLQ